MMGQRLMPYSPDTLYQIVEHREEFCHPERGWKAWATEHLLCPQCRGVPPKYYPRAIDIRLDPPPKRSVFEHIAMIGVKVFRLELIEILKQHLTDYAIGDCFDKHGERVHEYVTCYTKNRIITRGNRYSHYRVCDVCSLAWLKTDWQIKKDGNMDEFILRKDLEFGHVLQHARMSLYVSSLVAESINWERFRDVELYPVRIIDRPFDDERLPGDPDWAAMKS